MTTHGTGSPFFDGVGEVRRQGGALERDLDPRRGGVGELEDLLEGVERLLVELATARVGVAEHPLGLADVEARAVPLLAGGAQVAGSLGGAGLVGDLVGDGLPRLHEDPAARVHVGCLARRAAGPVDLVDRAPLLSVAQTPRFQTYLGPVKYSNMTPTVPVVTRVRNLSVVMRGIADDGFRSRLRRPAMGT